MKQNSNMTYIPIDLSARAQCFMSVEPDLSFCRCFESPISTFLDCASRIGWLHKMTQLFIMVRAECP